MLARDADLAPVRRELTGRVRQLGSSARPAVEAVLGEGTALRAVGHVGKRKGGQLGQALDAVPAPAAGKCEPTQLVLDEAS